MKTRQVILSCVFSVRKFAADGYFFGKFNPHVIVIVDLYKSLLFIDFLELRWIFELLDSYQMKACAVDGSG
ncbi:hypothetical protein V6N12_053314 [Hibiscus sabdariffa]|uniref:Uncharacterized protein n=1 Tax=Hibiscus sabdariffa TaxID=183260 RepID=A0ABR2D767_9ROSI